MKTIFSPLLFLTRDPSFRVADLVHKFQVHLSFTADQPALDSKRLAGTWKAFAQEQVKD